MKWNTIEEVPERLKRIGGAPVTLEQANKIAEWADFFANDESVRNPWGVAVAHFRRTHEIADGLWEKNGRAPGVADSRTRVAIRFARKHFRDAAEAEEWIESETDLPLDNTHTVEERPDGFYYLLRDYDTGAKTEEEKGDGLGVFYIYVDREAAQGKVKNVSGVDAEENNTEDDAVVVDNSIGDDRTSSGEGTETVCETTGGDAGNHEADSAGSDTQPGGQGTFDIENVEIFKTGAWTDSAGRTIEYTEDDLREMAEAYEELKGRFEAPVKLGHEPGQELLKSDGLPAAGWLTNLRVRGGSLVADLKDVPRKIYELLKSNAYKKRSLEVLHDFRDDAAGRVYKHVAAGLALLGAQLPAIGSLSDINGLYESSSQAAAYLYDTDATGRSITGAEACSSFSAAQKTKKTGEDEAATDTENAAEATNKKREPENGGNKSGAADSQRGDTPADDDNMTGEKKDDAGGKEKDSEPGVGVTADAESKEEENDDKEKDERQREDELEEEFRRQLKETTERLEGALGELERCRVREHERREQRRRRFLETRGRFIPPAFHDVILDVLAMLEGDAPQASDYAGPAGGSTAAASVYGELDEADSAPAGGDARFSAAESFMNFIDAVGEHPAMSEYGAQGPDRRLDAPAGDADLDKRIAAWCAERGLDPDDASAYARAAAAVSIYTPPMPLNAVD